MAAPCAFPLHIYYIFFYPVLTPVVLVCYDSFSSIPSYQHQRTCISIHVGVFGFSSNCGCLSFWTFCSSWPNGPGRVILMVVPAAVASQRTWRHADSVSKKASSMFTQGLSCFDSVACVRKYYMNSYISLSCAISAIQMLRTQ